MTQTEALVEAIKGLRDSLNQHQAELNLLRGAMLGMAEAGCALEARVGALEHTRPRIVIPGGS